MLRLNDQHLEHHNKIKRRAAALRSIAIAKPLNEPAAQIFEIDRRCQVSLGFKLGSSSFVERPG